MMLIVSFPTKALGDDKQTHVSFLDFHSHHNEYFLSHSSLLLGEKLDERIFVGGIFLLLGMFVAVVGHTILSRRKIIFEVGEAFPS